MVLLPKDVVVTINGSVFTTQIYNFTEDGGRKNVSYVKTLNRHSQEARDSPSDLTLSFELTPDGNGSLITMWNDQYNNNVNLSLAWAGEMTITYNNANLQQVNYSMSADDRLIARLDADLPVFNSVGSLNRVVT